MAANSFRGRPITRIASTLRRPTVQLSRAVALEGIRAAPGVVRGAHRRFWWTFDADAVRCAIGVAQEGREEEEEEVVGGLPPRSDGGRREEDVAELQGFLTR